MPSQCGRIVNPKGNTVIISEIEFRQITVQMLLAAMLVNALHASLEDAVEAFEIVRMAFEAAERDGLAPLAVLVDTPPSLDGGAAVAFARETELA